MITFVLSLIAGYVLCGWLVRFALKSRRPNIRYR